MRQRCPVSLPRILTPCDDPTTYRIPAPEEVHESKWRSWEYRAYLALTAATAVASLVRLIPACSPTGMVGREVQQRLSNGWLFGRQMDLTDPQHSQFRSSLPILIVLATLHPLLGRFCHDPRTRLSVSLGFSLVFVMALHGLHVIFPLSILLAQYFVISGITKSQFATTRVTHVAIWASNILILFLNEFFYGYSFEKILLGSAFGTWMDSFAGLGLRWHVIFNVTTLRILSYQLDFTWSLLPESSRDGARGSSSQRSKLDEQSEMMQPLILEQTAETTQIAEDHDREVIFAKDRVETSRSPAQYQLLEYLAYILYAPLYIAGPIMTFNDFIAQSYSPLNVTWTHKITYMGRFMFSLLSIEVLSHLIYANAIKDSPAWGQLTPPEALVWSIYGLFFVWLKLLVPWRFFRLWALLDNFVAPENMLRCIIDNPTIGGFWRAWHRSFNLWIVRYIYIPVGGSKRPVLAIILSFTFVAGWHDIGLHLLVWGWIMSLFLIPEIAAGFLFPHQKFGRERWYHFGSALGSGVTVSALIIANLTGFYFGLEGAKSFIHQMLKTKSGILFAAFALLQFSVFSMINFEYREMEKRSGISRKC